MKKIKLGICTNNDEYGTRFHNYVMNHQKNKIECFIFSSVEKIQEFTAEKNEKLDVIVFSSLKNDDLIIIKNISGKKLYLYDEDEDIKEIKDMKIIDKFQEVSKIIDEIFKETEDEISIVQEDILLTDEPRIIGIYSLSDSQLQLSMAVTVANILKDTEEALLIDLQENSGLSECFSQENENIMGLEDVLIMAQNKKISRKRMYSCIGNTEYFDYIYPLKNSSYLSEIEKDVWDGLIKLIARKLSYSTIIVNLGSRFSGFFQLLSQCSEIYLVGKKSKLKEIREESFKGELEKNNQLETLKKISSIEIPRYKDYEISASDCINQWKWSEFGDDLRKKIVGAN
ncbi:hypothetical protein SAMN04487761_10324 [Lachnospiraceae bacterium C7]|nr:hypothetical protein SAMN04487761_10324 [Lachnospiraceae bacterium C7]